MLKVVRINTLLIVVSLILTACNPTAYARSGGPEETSRQEKLTIYSGRSETLVEPIIAQFEEASGIDVQVRWGDTAELAATLLEEGGNSPTDIFYAQDPGGLGAVAEMLAPLPDGVLDLADARFRDPAGRWVGLSGRVRTVVYNTERVDSAELPADIWDFVDPRWKGKIGWAPTNTSFQTMLTAMRASWGEAKTREWLQGILANNPVAYEKNSAIVAAVGTGEVEVGFVNHYYLLRFLSEEGDSFKARNHFLENGPGSLLMVSGAGILKTSQNQEAAARFLRFMLSPVAQQYFAMQTFEYPVVEGLVLSPDLEPLDRLNPVPIDVADLSDLQGSLRMLRELGAIP